MRAAGSPAGWQKVWCPAGIIRAVLDWRGSDASRFKPSVLDSHAAEERHALYDQIGRLLGGGRVAGFIAISAEDTHPAHDHVPGFRNHDFHAAENRRGINDRACALDNRFAQIELVAAKDGGKLGVGEIGLSDAPFPAP